jgi:hypothetical protein
MHLRKLDVLLCIAVNALIGMFFLIAFSSESIFAQGTDKPDLRVVSLTAKKFKLRKSH